MVILLEDYFVTKGAIHFFIHPFFAPFNTSFPLSVGHWALVLDHCFSVGGDFPHKETSGNIWRHFCLSQPEGSAAGIQRVEVREDANHPTMHKMVPHNQE